MKNKLSPYALHTIVGGITVPLALFTAYIGCLIFKTDMAKVLLLREAAKAAEAALGCITFSLGCAFLWERACRVHGLY